jgi:hypothetical protein
MSDARVAERLDMDEGVVRRIRHELEAGWRSRLSDVEGMRALLVQMGWHVYQLALTDHAEAPIKSRSGLLNQARLMLSGISDLLGLKSFRIDVGSSQLQAILEQLAAVKAVAAELPALSTEQRTVIDGDCRVVGE